MKITGENNQGFQAAYAERNPDTRPKGAKGRLYLFGETVIGVQSYYTCV